MALGCAEARARTQNHIFDLHEIPTFNQDRASHPLSRGVQKAHSAATHLLTWPDTTSAFGVSERIDWRRTYATMLE